MTHDPNQIWKILEEDIDRGGAVEVQRRIRPESVADLWLVVTDPGHLRTLRIVVDDATDLATDLPLGDGIETRLSATSKGPALEVTLTKHAYADLFETLVEDVVAAASSATAAEQVAALVAARILRWQAFLKEHPEGLTPSKQKGLYGELHVLATLADAIGPDTATMAWVGPDARPQDFNVGSCAIEVKTGTGKKPQRIPIASELQLDDTAVDALFLWHVSVDARVGSGETLPELVTSIRDRLLGTATSAEFEERLFSSGYLDVNAVRYTAGYTIRSENVYAVSAGFPRLVEVDCPPGVGDVRYSIEVGALKPFEVDAETAIETMAVAVDD